MFFQPPVSVEEKESKILPKQGQPGSSTTLKTPARPKRRRKKKQNNKNKQFAKKLFERKSRFASSMSSWAESFTVAATWQLKHQVAHWKAKAKALEYENRVLHGVIKKNYLKVPRNDLVLSESEDDSESVEDESLDNEEEGLEVSEEFIEFIRANAEYKEDARREREKFREKQLAEENALKLQLECPPVIEDNAQNLKELYGEHWQRIGAVEMASQARFIEESDNNTKYWPVIPFNFNFS